MQSEKNQKVHLRSQRLLSFLPLLILIPGMIASTMIASNIRDQNAEEYSLAQRQQTAGIKYHLQSRFSGYDELLRAGATIFDLNGDVSREEWNKFYNNMDVSDRYPALLGLGYTKCLQPDEVHAHNEAMRAEGITDYTVHPDIPRSEYTAITYLEPNSSVNQRALGYDMFSDPTRRKAMETARDENRISMSAPTALVQDSDKPQNQRYPGVLLYYPVYDTPTPPGDVAGRRAHLRGYTYAAIRPHDVFMLYAKDHAAVRGDGRVKLTDATDSSPIAFTRSDRAVDTTYDEAFPINRRLWHISLAGRDTLINRYINPLVWFGLGVLLTISLTAAFYYLLQKRFREVHETYDRQIQQTKNELLALASHQLRTPASGVKQYLGMMVQGFVGTLTADQQEIAEKAYAANERQLEIINQLLYVSKADAGQLHIDHKKIDLPAIVHHTIGDTAAAAKAKDIIVTYDGPKKLPLIADSRYIGMIIDNLLTNAIKYSNRSSEVHISLSEASGTAQLAIKDSGVGIAAADIEKLFSKFSRIDNPLSRSEGGSGLGLFLSRQLAIAHGGDITVQSETDKGSAFTFRVPIDGSGIQATATLSTHHVRRTHKNKLTGKRRTPR